MHRKNGGAKEGGRGRGKGEDGKRHERGVICQGRRKVGRVVEGLIGSVFWESFGLWA